MAFMSRAWRRHVSKLSPTSRLNARSIVLTLAPASAHNSANDVPAASSAIVACATASARASLGSTTKMGTTSKPARARRFYRDTLGLCLVSEDEFALAFDARGTMLRVSIVKEVVAAGYTVLGWQVPDIVAAAKRLQEVGVRLQRYPGTGQDTRGVWTSPSGARVAWFKDPDGNILSLTELPAAP